jgi:hypothetical protein
MDGCTPVRHDVRKPSFLYGAGNDGRVSSRARPARRRSSLRATLAYTRGRSAVSRCSALNPDDVGTVGQGEVLRSATFSSLRRLHPQATVWPQAGSIVETRRPGGGQRFIITRPIVDGCHACKLLGAARYAYDFAPAGVPRGQSFVDARAGNRAWFGR